MLDHHPIPMSSDMSARTSWRRPSVVLSAAAALIPTVLSAVGMVGVATDVLSMDLAVAWALAIFLEAALLAAAIRAHELVQAGHRPTHELTATWVLSGLSGTFSAAHALVSAPDGVAVWVITPATLIAAGVRLAAPLVACHAWHRVLHADAVHVEDKPSRREVRTRRAMHAVASAAVRVRTSGERTRPLAQWRLRRAHDHLLSLVPPMSGRRAELDLWLSAVGLVDVLPERTNVRTADLTPEVPASTDTPPGQPTTAEAISEPSDTDVSDDLGGEVTPLTRLRLTSTTNTDMTNAQSADSAQASSEADTTSGVGSDHSTEVMAKSENDALSKLQDIMSELEVTNMTGREAAKNLTDHGHPVSARHARRLVRRLQKQAAVA